MLARGSHKRRISAKQTNRPIPASLHFLYITNYKYGSYDYQGNLGTCSMRGRTLQEKEAPQKAEEETATAAAVKVQNSRTFFCSSHHFYTQRHRHGGFLQPLKTDQLANFSIPLPVLQAVPPSSTFYYLPSLLSVTALQPPIMKQFCSLH